MHKHKQTRSEFQHYKKRRYVFLNPGPWLFQFLPITHPVLATRVVNSLLDKLPRDPPRGLFVENGVHEGDAGGAATGFGFCGAGLRGIAITINCAPRLSNIVCLLTP
jgi:hypothetical protein